MRFKLRNMLFVCILATLFLCVGRTDEVYANIASGASWTCSWVIDDNGVLTIEPSHGDSGLLASNDSGNGPWYSYRSKIKKVVVKPGVQANKGCYCLFYNFNACTEIDIVNLDTSNVENMYGMFQGCSRLKNLNISNFDTSKVKTMQNMFYDCSGLTTLDVSGFETNNVVNMSCMFYNCSSLESIDIKNFDVSNVTTFSSMFYNCSMLGVGSNNCVDLSKWNTVNMGSCSLMFYGCKNVHTIDLSNWSLAFTTNQSFGGMLNNNPNLDKLIRKTLQEDIRV